MKTNYITEWWLVSLFCIYENHYELELSGALFSYDICHVEHDCNTLYGSYTTAELISLHIFEVEYFINPFEVVFGCFLCLKVGIVVVISNWK